MRIAIASSGLGHVARGIETWADDTAAELARRGLDVTLFSAGDQPRHPYEQCLSCWRRSTRRATVAARLLRRGTWSWGLGHTYGIEQATFWLKLRRRLRQGRYDILHVQDPFVAIWCGIWRRRGWLATREILGHGTEESLDFRLRLPFVQELAPWHLEQARDQLLHQRPGALFLTDNWTALPNFVDVDRFHPPAAGEPNPYREQAGAGPDDTVWVCAAALKRQHKRIDFLIDAFGSALARLQREGRDRLPYLLIAGARTHDTSDLLERARALGHGHIHLMSLPRAEMPAFLRAGDVFVLSSLFEMMPIAVLEALATGLPVVANNHPILSWMTGDGGRLLDLETQEALVDFVATADPGDLRAAGALARRRACEEFATGPVVDRYLDYYQHVLAVDLEHA